jgi:hypothetical protein
MSVRAVTLSPVNFPIWTFTFAPQPLIVIPNLRSEGAQERDLTMRVKFLGRGQDVRNASTVLPVCVRTDPPAS